MRPALKSVGLTLLLVCSTAVALCVPANMGRSPVLAQATTTPDRADLKLYQQAMEQYRKGRYREALKTAEQALRQYRQLKDSAAVGQTLNLIAEIYIGLDPVQKALPILQEALAIHRQLGDRSREAEALNSLGTVYAILNQTDQAFTALQQALAMQRSVNDRSGEARTLSRLGMLTVTAKKDPHGLELLQQALSMQQQAADQFQIGFTLWRLGQAYWSLNKTEPAMTVFETALAANRQSGNIVYEARTLQGIGLIDMDIKKFDQAIAAFLQALPLFQRAGMRSMEGITLVTIGLAYVPKEQSKNTILYLEKARSIVAESPDQNQYGDLLRVLVGAYFDVDDRPHWLMSYQKALAVYQQTKNDLSRLGILLQVMTHYELFADRQKESMAYTSAITDLNQVIILAPQALELARKLKRPDDVKRAFSSQSGAYSSLSSLYEKLADLPEAKAFAEQALATARQAQDLRDESRALNRLGSYYNAFGNYPQSMNIWQRILTIAQRLKTPFEEAQALSGLASAYSVLGDTPKFSEMYPQALAKAAEINAQNLPDGLDNENVIELKLNLLGGTSSGFWTLGQHDKALDYAQQKLQLARTSSKREREVEALVDVGKLQNLSDTKLAQATFEQALALANTLNQPILKAEVLVELSEVIAVDHPQQAIELAQQALTLVRTEKTQQADHTRFAKKESSAIEALSNAYKTQGNYAKALALLQEDVTVSQQSKNPSDYQSALITLGEFYGSLGDYSSAAKQFQQVKINAQKTQQVGWNDLALFLLAKNAFSQGKPKTAIALAQEKLALAERYQSRRAAYQSQIIFYLGYAELGDRQKALSAAQTSLELARQMSSPTLEQEALAFVGHTYRRFGEWDQALTYFQAALAVRELKDAPGIYMGLAQVYAHRKQSGTAIAFYKQAINSIEKTRRGLQGLAPDLQKSFLQATFDFGGVKTADVYRQLADLLIAQGRIGEAQQVLELLKLKELDDFTHTARSGEKSQGIALSPTEATIIKNNGTLIAFGQKISACQSQQTSNCNALRDQLTALTAQYNADLRTLETDLRNRSSADEEFINPNSQFGKAAATLIKENPDTLLVYPLVLEDKVWLLMAGQGGILKKFEVKVDRKTLSETVRQFRDLLQTPHSDPAKLQATSYQLYTWLIQPLETELASKRANQPAIHNLVFALDRVTRYIPMAALFDGKHYLMEHYTVSTIIAASFGNTRDHAPLLPQTSNVLAMGVSAAAGFPPLPNVKAELEAIVQRPNHITQGIYPGQEFLDQAFDFRALQNNLTGYRILHIATHGKFEPGNAYASYLVMGKGDKLKIADIQNLPNLGDINLVTLSACETALGGAGDGIEIAGISSYFLSKGAQAVAASLWSVDDASTSLLMQQFYKNLATGKLSKAEALQQAQLSLLQGKLTAKDALKQRATLIVKAAPQTQQSQNGDFSHPYYWAPFILIGNGL